MQPDKGWLVYKINQIWKYHVNVLCVFASSLTGAWWCLRRPTGQTFVNKAKLTFKLTNSAERCDWFKLMHVIPYFLVNVTRCKTFCSLVGIKRRIKWMQRCWCDIKCKLTHTWPNNVNMRSKPYITHVVFQNNLHSLLMKSRHFEVHSRI